jgi:hypothetical protein
MDGNLGFQELACGDGRCLRLTNLPWSLPTGSVFQDSTPIVSAENNSETSLRPPLHYGRIAYPPLRRLSTSSDRLCRNGSRYLFGCGRSGT